MHISETTFIIKEISTWIWNKSSNKSLDKNSSFYFPAGQGQNIFNRHIVVADIPLTPGHAVQLSLVRVQPPAGANNDNDSSSSDNDDSSGDDSSDDSNDDAANNVVDGDNGVYHDGDAHLNVNAAQEV